MVFIRRKQIKSKFYAYLVENTWVDGRSKQAVKEYLGRILDVDERPQASLSSVDPADLLRELIEYETQFVDAEVDIDNQRVILNGRDVVLSLNGGHLCSYTLKQIQQARKKKNEERPGLALAQALSEAGLRMNKEDFIRLYLHEQL